MMTDRFVAALLALACLGIGALVYDIVAELYRQRQQRKLFATILEDVQRGMARKIPDIAAAARSAHQRIDDAGRR